MDYPFWDVFVGHGVLMALIAVVHVFISHFAIGGGLYLVVEEMSARRRGDASRLAFLEHLSRFEDAVASYRSLLERDPDCAAAREGVERGLRASGDTVGLAEFLAELVDSHPDPGARESFALERAVILEEVLDRVEEATETYRQIALEARDPHHRERASGRLEALLERAGDWPGLRAHWEHVLDACPEEEKGRVHERLAG